MTNQAPTRRAACACGNLTAVCTGEPARISICHCLDCQRRTGSAFAHGATYAAEQVATAGLSQTWTRTSDDGFRAAFHFCPHCAGTVFDEIKRRPGMITIPIGNFADPSFPEPRVSVYGERRHPWVSIATAEPIEEC